MKYTALTGATGLLGGFILKDLMRKDLPVVVLIRSNRMETALQRIEGILRRHERQLGRPLPRPVVMEANLHEESLGLSREQKAWLARHADTMIHNAASLTFIAEDNGEPYKSNVDGTRNVLELCRETGIRRFHHVSTAYVCGRRKGLILESELDAGQEFGNDYEKSKFTSETMVRNSEFLDSVTVFRPAIIVGDSATGYTSTFHGFYAPMKILVPLLQPDSVDFKNLSTFAAILGMNPRDRKNFVPVDWISRVMSTVICNPKLHDSCYHLAAGNRVTIDQMSQTIAEGITRYKKKNESSLAGSLDADKLLPMFREQMKVYQAYWKDDPEFDMSNTRRAVPQYPPMEMTPELLMVFVRFAIESHFGWPRPKPTQISFEAEKIFSGGNCLFFNSLSDAPRVNNLQNLQDTFALRVSGPGGGDWTIMGCDSGKIVVESGCPADSTPVMTLNAITLEEFARTADCDLLAARTAWENGTNEQWSRACRVLANVVLKKETLS
ncbi:MAG: SDR family oxidoreductase [Planctomycetia bacterium]|nr:SDR family oxidoreductase [Planctomycetia bacterium]